VHEPWDRLHFLILCSLPAGWTEPYSLLFFFLPFIKFLRFGVTFPTLQHLY
jgi:hypothetical protein